MNRQTACEFQSAVIKSLKSKIANDQIEAHLKNCADCRETLKVARFFHPNVMVEPSPSKLPVAGLVWWKAKLREKHRTVGRASQPITIVQTIAVISFTVVFLWLFNLESLHLATLGEGLSRVADSIPQFIIPTIIGFISFAAVCLATVLLMRRFLPDR